MRPSASIACAPQPLAQALQLLQSALRLRPNQRKVLGMASEAPSGHTYLQYGRSMKIDRPKITVTNVTYGQLRLVMPTRKVVLKGSTSESFSASPMENSDTTTRPKNTAYLIHFRRSALDLRQLELEALEAHGAGHLVDDLPDGTERAGPAAEQAAAKHRRW